MPEINANIVVEPIQLSIVPNEPTITVAPEPLNLNIYTGGIAAPSGNTGDIQYNAGGAFGGIPTANYVAGNLSLGDVANLKVDGGNNAYFLQTDGTGNLTWAPGTGNIIPGNGVAAGANTQIQFSDGAGGFVAAAGFTFDYASNIFSAPGLINGGGNLVVSNANLGNLAEANYVQGTLTTASQPNITTVGNLTGLRTTSTNVTLGNLAGNSFQSGNAIAIGNNAGYLQQYDNAIAIGRQAGNSNQSTEAIAIGYLAGYEDQGNSSIAIGYLSGGANLSGNGQEIQAIAIGASAGEKHQGANSVAIGFAAGRNEQHDNSIVLNASGANLDTGSANAFYVKPIRNTNAGNILFYNQTTGEISYDLGGTSIVNGNSNISIPVANGNITMSVAGNANVLVVTSTGINVTSNINASGNIVSPQLISNIANGTPPLIVNSTTLVANLNVANANFATTAGNITGTAANANYALYSGTVLTNAQPNITSLGTLTSLSLSNTKIELGASANAANLNNIAIGNISEAAGSNVAPAIAIGESSYATQGAIAIGEYVGKFATDKASSANYSIAIGQGTGYGNSRGVDSIAIGRGTGLSQGANSIAIGSLTQALSTPINGIAIGARAGYDNQGNNSIIINATGSNLTSTTANAFFVKPIRNLTQSNFLYYDSNTGEITYDTGGGGNTTAAGLPTQVQFNSANLLDASSAFIFDPAVNNLTVTGNIISTNQIVSNVANGTAPFIVVSNTVVSNLRAANASTANTAGTVTTNAQPNITSLGTLTNLSISGNLNAGNTTIGNGVVNINTGLGGANAATVIEGNLTVSATAGSYDILLDGVIKQKCGTFATTTGNITLNRASYASYYQTANATGNLNLNISSINLNNGECCDARIVIKQGATAYYINDPIQVNGSNVTTYFPASYSPATNGQTIHDIEIRKLSGTITAFVVATNVDYQ